MYIRHAYDGHNVTMKNYYGTFFHSYNVYYSYENETHLRSIRVSLSCHTYMHRFCRDNGIEIPKMILNARLYVPSTQRFTGWLSCEKHTPRLQENKSELDLIVINNTSTVCAVCKMNLLYIFIRPYCYVWFMVWKLRSTWFVFMFFPRTKLKNKIKYSMRKVFENYI